MTRPPDTAVTDLSASDEWATPPELFAALAALYGPFQLDAAANAKNTKCARWYGPGGVAADAPSELVPLPGVKRVFLNSPYSRGSLDRFIGWARSMVLAARYESITCVVPGHTAEGWWHRHVLAAAGAYLGASHGESVIGARDQVRWESLTVERLTIRGRVRFVEASGATGSARFPSVAVTFARPGVLPSLEVRRRRRGPKPIVTPEIEAYIRAEVDRGTSISAACEGAGIARKTWYRFLHRRQRC